ncbi:hypothetical protein N0V83_009563 [Neocucurbitaria cava]|uniref:Heterokaryon incompatibility domain-containing protein n=1 Tax=Neocucurbitaria cava TaxID=798079 RepID=A0A9W8Y2X8_9PLEO|nr:hypothetical protein N0V83_009563 [Neocucurbitaria cava]
METPIHSVILANIRKGCRWGQRILAGLLTNAKLGSKVAKHSRDHFSHSVDDLSEDSILTPVLCAEYWDRVWTLQEFALPKRSLVLGKYITISADHFWYSQWLLQRLEGKGSGSSGYCFHVSLRTWLHDTMDSRNAKGGREPYQLLGSGSEEGVLEKLLGDMRALKATDAKDKVFALQALLQAAGFDIGPPDYSKSVAVVYAETTRKIIKATSSLNVLTLATTIPASAEMPSWVPDWSGESYPSFAKCDTELPRATEASTYTDDSEAGTMELNVQGIVMGIVEEVSRHCMTWRVDPSTLTDPVSSSNPDLWKDVLAYFVRLSQSWVDMAGLTKPYSEWTDEFWKRQECLASVLLAMVLNTQVAESPAAVHDEICRIIQLICEGDPSSAYYTEDFRTLIQSEFMDSPAFRAYFTIAHNKPLCKRLNSLYLANYKRSIFRTKDFLGCGLHSLQKGDLLVLLKGGNMPFIVSSTVEGWHLRGPAFVPGLMQGEAWPESEDRLTTFKLV